MQKSSEQQNYNGEQEPLLGVPAEFLEQEQELSLEQRGQRLAAQIKDMHEKAQTKADYLAVQVKIAELRKMFEVENKELPSAYRNVFATMLKASNHLEVGENVDPALWEWKLYQPSLGSGHDTTKLTVSMRVKLDVATYKDADEYDFSKLLDSSSQRWLDSDIGIENLFLRIDYSNVKSYVNESGEWALEVEPQPFDDFSTVYNNILKKISGSKLATKAYIAKFKGSNNIFIDTEYDFSELDNVTDMDFCSFPPVELLMDLKVYENNNSAYIEEVKNFYTLEEKFAGKKARSYNVNGRWMMEVQDEPEKETKTKSLEDTILNGLVFLAAHGCNENRFTFNWVLSKDKKYIRMFLKVDDEIASNKNYFHAPDNNDIASIKKDLISPLNSEICLGIQKLQNEVSLDKKATSLIYENEWYIKLED